MAVREETGCEVFSVNKEKVKAVKELISSDETIQRLSETFKALGDPTRIKLLFALSKEELCVCEIASFLGVSPSAISHQLRVLRNMRLVKYRKEGKMVYYSLDDRHIENLFNEGLKHVEEGNG